VLGEGACIRGLRITVEASIGYLASGMSTADILREWPELDELDIRQAPRVRILVGRVAKTHVVLTRTSPGPVAPRRTRDIC
jgi:uncharacterized protein (DUF433 family)